jgi:hypothetical protein
MFKLVAKNTFLHVQEQRETRVRSHSDPTDVLLDEGMQRKEAMLRPCDFSPKSSGKNTPKSRAAPTEDRKSECSTHVSDSERTPTWTTETPELNPQARPRSTMDPLFVETLKEALYAVYPLPQSEVPATRKERPRRRQDLGSLTDDVTLMLRNIPNKYTQEQLLADLDSYRSAIDFLYLPTDFKNTCNLGYAFLNFSDGQAAEAFASEHNGQRLPRFPLSPKVLSVQCARVQGLQANIERFRDSSVMGVQIEAMKPMLFENGVQIPFPAPSGDLPPLGLRRRRGAVRKDKAAQRAA